MWLFRRRCDAHYSTTVKPTHQPARTVIVRCELRAGHRESHLASPPEDQPLASRKGHLGLVVWHDEVRSPGQGERASA